MAYSAQPQSTTVNTPAKMKKPFRVFGTMGWLEATLGNYKNAAEAQTAIDSFEKKKIYKNLRFVDMSQSQPQS